MKTNAYKNFQLVATISFEDYYEIAYKTVKARSWREAHYRARQFSNKLSNSMSNLGGKIFVKRIIELGEVK